MPRITTTPLDSVTSRLATADTADYLDNETRAAGAMRVSPQSFTIDASRGTQLEIEILDPLDAIGSGLQSVRVDWEKSDDNGATWIREGFARFDAGSRPNGKDPRRIITLPARVTETAIDEAGNQIIRLVAFTWPNRTQFRFHVRQTAAGRLGIVCNLDK